MGDLLQPCTYILRHVMIMKYFAGFWAQAGIFFSAVLHLLAVLQAILDEMQKRYSLSMTSICPLLKQSRSLSTKLKRQCSDPLSVCTETISEWCRILPSSLPSLLTLESRMLLFFRTAFGPLHFLDVFQDISHVIEEGMANPVRCMYEDESLPSLVSSSSLLLSEFDGSIDSTMLYNRHFTLFQHLEQLGRLQRLRVRA